VLNIALEIKKQAWKVGSVGKSSDVTLAGSTQQTIGNVATANVNGTRSTKSWDNERDTLLAKEEDR
jgi:hypothetical protein